MCAWPEAVWPRRMTSNRSRRDSCSDWRLVSSVIRAIWQHRHEPLLYLRIWFICCIMAAVTALQPCLSYSYIVIWKSNFVSYEQIKWRWWWRWWRWCGFNCLVILYTATVLVTAENSNAIDSEGSTIQAKNRHASQYRLGEHLMSGGNVNHAVALRRPPRVLSWPPRHGSCHRRRSRLRTAFEPVVFVVVGCCGLSALAAQPHRPHFECWPGHSLLVVGGRRRQKIIVEVFGVVDGRWRLDRIAVSLSLQQTIYTEEQHFA